MNKRLEQIIDTARQEALQLKSDYVGTEHLLLAIAKEENSSVARFLKNLGIYIDKVAENAEDTTATSPTIAQCLLNVVAKRAEKEMGVADVATAGTIIPLTPRAKLVLGKAEGAINTYSENLDAAQFLLLEMIRDTKSEAAEVLAELGISDEAELRRVLSIRKDKK
ncbi:MAG: Clp protease N-terminal domain-containing protein [Chitinivibrionia bacterium]|nr:Clp protease N-terminal domain-containing protein [Chitinivibrionia bacterium]